MSEAQDAILALTLGAGASPEVAARRFFSQQGFRAGRSGRDTIGGLPAYTAFFEAADEQGTLQGQVSFVSYEGRIYRILGYTSAGRFSTYQGAFDSSIRSFRRLSDPRYLDVQPRRIALVDLDQQMDLRQFARAYPSTVGIETLGLINGVAANQMPQAGSWPSASSGAGCRTEARSGPLRLERLAGLGIAAGITTPRREARPAGPRRPRVVAPARPGYWWC